MTKFAVVVLTAPPLGQGAEAIGALAKIDGREAILRSTELFLNRDNVVQIQLVVASGLTEEIKRKFGGNLGFLGIKLTTATDRWNGQVATAAEKVAAEATHVILHDAARPLVPFGDIDALMDAAESHPAVTLTAPLKSSLLELDEGGGVIAAITPASYVQMLTPQAMTRQRFVELSKRDIHPSEWFCVKGSGLNIRVGSPADEKLAKALLGLMPKPKIKAANNPFEEAQW